MCIQMDCDLFIHCALLGLSKHALVFASAHQGKMVQPEFSTISNGGQNTPRTMAPNGFHNQGAALDDSDEEYQTIPEHRDMRKPSAMTTVQNTAEQERIRRLENSEEEKARQRERRERMKKRAQSAAKTTGKVVTSSYTCGVCVSVAGAITMICGIIMITIGNNEKQVRDDPAGKNFMLIGGSLFFLFGLAMLSAAVIYTLVHYIRKRNKEKNDPFKIKATEKEAREQEKAQAEGRAVTPIKKVGGAPPPVLPICAPEHEHASVTEQRMKETRRQSLFVTSSQSSNDIEAMGGESKKPAPMKKSQSAFNFGGILGGGKKKKGRSSSLQPLADDSLATTKTSPLPPIKTSRSALNLEAQNSPRMQQHQEKTNMSRAMNDGKKFKRSQSAAQLEFGGGSGDVFGMKGMKSGGLGQLPPLTETPSNRTTVHTISEVTDFDDSEI